MEACIDALSCPVLSFPVPIFQQLPARRALGGRRLRLRGGGVELHDAQLVERGRLAGDESAPQELRRDIIAMDPGDS